MIARSAATIILFIKSLNIIIIIRLFLMGNCYSVAKSARDLPGKAFSGHKSIAKEKSTKMTLRSDDDAQGGNI